MSKELLERASAWAAADPDPATAKELRDLVAAKDELELADRFAQELEFGTAGLRGVLGAGTNRMNRAVVMRATWGLAQHLLASNPRAKDRGVVIGFDGRRMSRELARDTAEVLAGAGVRVYLFDDLGPTPLLAFALTHLDCAAGVMITASHNPPEYNGYKAYWRNGAQIVPPTDVAIAAAIAKAPPAKEIPRVDLDRAKRDELVVIVGDDERTAYLAGVRELSVQRGGDRSIPIAYTPLHGVGDRLTRAALAAAGFSDVHSVRDQKEPDGAFPTVRFPNPEEQGAMDLVLALAKKIEAKLVLANDPDADRLAVAVPDGAGGYTQLTGNQVGVLLGHYLLTGGLTDLTRAQRERSLVIASIVSSPMLGDIARALGARYEETLTGFKWIANRAMELAASDNTRFVFGYEEALGYTVGDLVRDKDGVSAAMIFAELAAVLAARDEPLLAHLEGLYRRYGLYLSTQVNLVRKGVEGAAEIAAMMKRLREAPPAEIAGLRVVATCDYAAGVRRDASGERALTLPKSNVLAFELEGGCRVIARPSGTEPKAKFYVDVREQMKDGEPLAAAEARARATMERLGEAIVRAATG